MSTKRSLYSAFSVVCVLGALIVSASPAAAQCSNATINSALNSTLSSLGDVSQLVVNQYSQLTASGQPTAAQLCDPNRYAAGSYTAATLPNYIRASLVCQDPWIAEAFLDLGLQVNGHAATVPDSTGTGFYSFDDNSSVSAQMFSVQGDCSAAKYGSWGNNYTTLKSNIQSAHATAAVPSPFPLSGALTFPAFNGIRGLSSSGAILGVNGSAISGAGFYFLHGGASLGVVSNNGSALEAEGTGSYAASLPGGQAITVQAVANPAGLLVDNSGNPVQIVASGAGNFQLKVIGQIVASGAGNIVASGAGNIVASGAGNVVSASAGNIILIGGSNIVASGAGNLQLQTNPAASDAAGLTAVLGPNLITQDGGTLINLQAALSKGLTNGSLSIIGLHSSGIIGLNSSGIIGLPGSGIIGLPGSGITPTGTAGIIGLNASGLTQNGAGGYQLANVKPVASGQPASTSGYSLTGFQTNPVGQTTWALGSPLNVAFQHNGPIPANDTLIISMQLAGSTQQITLATNVAVTPGTYAIHAPALTSTTNATLTLKDGVTGQSLAMGSPITMIPPGATSNIGSGAFKLTSFSISQANPSSWVLGSPLPLRWQYSGTIPAYDTLSVAMQINGSTQVIGLTSNIPIAPSSYSLGAPGGITANTIATLILKDGVSGQTLATLPGIALIPPSAGTPIAPVVQPTPAPAPPPGGGSGPFRLTSFSTYQPNQASWVLGSAFAVKWQYSGAIPAYDTLNVAMQINGSSQAIGLASNIPITAQSFSIPAPRGITANTIATLLLKDGGSGQTLATLPGIALIPAAPSVYTLTSFQTNPPNQTMWPASNLLPVSWTSSGMPASNQTVSIWMQWPGLTAPLPMSRGMSIPAGSTSGSISLPAPNPNQYPGLTPGSRVTLTLSNDLNTSQYYQVVASLGGAAAPAILPVATPQTAVMISQFAAPALWGNNTAIAATWNYSGYPAATQSVIVMLQYSAAMAPLPICQAAVSARTCRSSPYIWSSLMKTNTGGTLTLVDGVTRRPVVASPASITLSVR